MSYVITFNRDNAGLYGSSLEYQIQVPTDNVFIILTKCSHAHT